MRVQNIRIDTSPLSGARACVRADVSCDDSKVQPETYWFDVSENYAPYLNQSGNPWLACLVPLAVNLGEPLEISAPVDPTLFSNVQELMTVWRCWYPHLHPIPIDVDLAVSTSPRTSPRTAALFSGGVDAWFTLLRHAKGASVREIDDLISVWGLDISLDNPDGFQAMRTVQCDAAAAFAKEPIDMATNLCSTQWWNLANWGHLSHGCALAAIGLALEIRYQRLLVPSTHRYDHLTPWGSHPLTDPLLSSSLTQIVHDGAGYSRAEKTEFIIGFDMALNTLQVCWHTQSYRNCGRCSKCYRTMITLMLLDALGRCPRFDLETVDPKKISKILAKEESDRVFLREVQELALKRERPDIARAIERSFKHSWRIGIALRALAWLGNQRFVWRWREPLEHRLLRTSILP